MAVGVTGRVAAASVLLVLVLARVEPVTITQLQVPPLVNVSTRERVLLDCEYDVSDSQGLLVRWLFSGESYRTAAPVYEWSPPHRPVVKDPLRGRIDPSFRISEEPLKAHRALSVVWPSVLLSGEYTCQVSTRLGQAQQTSTMLVFSEEHDLRLSTRALPLERAVEVTCSVKNVYPEPELRLERFNSRIDKQSQKQWAASEVGGEGLLDATTTAVLPLAALRDQERFVCRLLLRPATYEAMRELHFNTTLYRNSDSRLNAVLQTTASQQATAPEHPKHTTEARSSAAALVLAPATLPAALATTAAAGILIT